VELFCAGDLPSAERHFRAAIELFADDDVDPAQWPLPNDPLGAVYAFLSPLQLFWGDEHGALIAAAAGVERCRELEFPRGPFTIAFVRTYEAWMHRERGMPDAAIAAAEEVIELGERHGFFDWVAAGRIQRLAATLAKEPSVAVLDELGDAIQAFRINGEEWILSSLLIDRGWGYLALGDLEQAESCLVETQEVLGHGQKTSLAEAHRLRAELVARRSGPHDPAVADELRAGMRFAIGQVAHLFVLRCGASYERWLGLDGLDADLRQAYEEAMARFGPTLSERERFLRWCGPDASMSAAGVQPTPAS
jgi:tetratricopeptide (TPR) repeat protein